MKKLILGLFALIASSNAYSDLSTGIESVTLDPTFSQITIKGNGLSSTGNTIVTLGGVRLATVSQTATALVVECPGTPAYCSAGDWSLQVSTYTNDTLPVPVGQETWDFTIGAVGPVGATGSVGPTGPKGSTGATGPTGAVGPQGPVGPIGNTGAIGPAGPVGAVGPVGATGSAGAVGPQGPVGPIGNTGPAGPKGDTGPAGIKGAIVDTGLELHGMNESGWNLFNAPTSFDKNGTPLPRWNTYHVKFKKAFSSPPVVTLGITTIDSDGPHVNAVTQNITTTGFDLALGTWNVWKVAALNVSWIAVE